MLEPAVKAVGLGMRATSRLDRRECAASPIGSPEGAKFAVSYQWRRHRESNPLLGDANRHKVAPSFTNDYDGNNKGNDDCCSTNDACNSLDNHSIDCCCRRSLRRQLGAG